jgi:hypothetical protein
VAKKIKDEKPKDPKEPKPKDEQGQSTAPQVVQPYAAISDVKAYVEKASVGVVHRELSMAYKGMISSLEIVEGWVKNIEEVQTYIESEKPKK